DAEDGDRELARVLGGRLPTGRLRGNGGERHRGRGEVEAEVPEAGGRRRLAEATTPTAGTGGAEAKDGARKGDVGGGEEERRQPSGGRDAGAGERQLAGAERPGGAGRPRQPHARERLRGRRRRAQLRE